MAENEQLFASKYRLYLPKEEELKQLIEQDRFFLIKEGINNKPLYTEARSIVDGYHNLNSY